jgi:predicted transcriptional regulator
MVSFLCNDRFNNYSLKTHATNKEISIMPQSALEMAKELVLAQVQLGQLQADQVQDALRQTHASLAELQAQEERGTTSVALGTETPPVDWRKSITKHTVTCLECGQSFKQLSPRHLMMHGLDPRSYRAKYGIPRTQPLTAKAVTARRRELVQETRPWTQAPTYLKAQGSNGHAVPEPEVEAAPDEVETSTAVATRPKRQRKTTQKKQRTRKAAQTT